MKRGQRGRLPAARPMAEEQAPQVPQAGAESPVVVESAEKGGLSVANKRPGKPPKKRQLVEAYLAEHPKTTAREVAEAILRDHGVSVTPVYVSMIRSRRRKGRGRRKKLAAAEAAPQETAAPAPPKSPLERMLTAEREALVRRLDAIDTLLKGR